MNLRWLRLALAFLWLAAGLAFLVADHGFGVTFAIPIGGDSLPLAWPFLLLGAFNLALWWAARPRPSAPARREMHRRRYDSEPDPRFQFDDGEP